MEIYDLKVWCLQQARSYADLKTPIYDKEILKKAEILINFLLNEEIPK